MNAFLQIAEMQQNAASKAKDRAREKRIANLVAKSESEAPMVASPTERAQFERQELATRYRKIVKAERQALLDGQHGREVKALWELMRTLTPESAPCLVAYVEKADWLNRADYKTRFDVLALIDTEIVRLRIRNGLPPFDDSLPFLNEAPTAFEQIRTMLMGVGA